MADYLNTLDGMHFDILKEIGNIGAGNAVTALAKMLGRKVDMQVPLVNLVEFKDMANLIGSPEDLVFGVLVNISGDINGMMMFLVKVDSARKLIESLTGSCAGDEEGFSDMDKSAIQEIGNILASSYLSALSTLVNLSAIPSVPYLSLDMAAAILSVPAIEFGKIADSVLFIESLFDDETEEHVSGYFILVPDMESFDKILESLGVK